MSKVIDVWRPLVPIYDQGEKVGLAEADHLLVKVDENENGRSVAVHPLMFADHLGLKDEWDNKSGYTVLGAAVEAELGGVDFPGDQLSAGQRGVVDLQMSL